MSECDDIEDVEYIKARAAEKREDSDRRLAELETSLASAVAEIALLRRDRMPDRADPVNRATKIMTFLNLETLVRRQIDAEEAKALAEHAAEQRGSREWTDALQKDALPAEKLRDATEKLITELRDCVDQNGYFTGVERAKVNEHVGERLRGKINADDLAVLRCAASTKRDISYWKFYARDVLRGLGETL
jgi:hypothetical protein